MYRSIRGGRPYLNVQGLQAAHQLLLCIAAILICLDDLHHDRLLLLVVKTRQAHIAAFVNKGRISGKVLTQSCLKRAEKRNISPFAEHPVCVKALPGPNYD